jgi:hypothetical protein
MNSRTIKLIIIISRVFARESCARDYSEVRQDLSLSENVFFVRPSNETTLSDTEKCALLSAVKTNPQRIVRMFTNHIDCEELSIVPSIQVIRFDPRDIFQGYPHFETWFESGVWNTYLREQHLSMSIRIALLHRFGGVYIDMDTATLRSLDNFVNTIGLTNPSLISPKVLAFERGHLFLALAEHSFVNEFRANESAWNERVFTQIWVNEGGASIQPLISLAHVEDFFVLSQINFQVYLQDYDKIVQTSRFITISETLKIDQASFYQLFLDKVLNSQSAHVEETNSISSNADNLSTPHYLDSFLGDWTLARCEGLDNGVNDVVRVNEIGLKLSNIMSWTLSVWIFLDFPDFSLRKRSYLARYENNEFSERVKCLPKCEMRITTNPVEMTSMTKILNENSFNRGGDILFLSIENGHVAIGDQRLEWKRTFSSIADHKWHHLGLIFNSDISQLRLTIDGILHIEHYIVSTTWMSTAWLEALVIGGKGNTYLHSLRFFPRSLAHSELVHLRNSQNSLICSPFEQSINDENGVSKSLTTRVMILILSDTRHKSAAIRKAVRNSWLKLLPSNTFEHSFCIGTDDVNIGSGASMIDIEQQLYSDLLVVDVADGYNFLSQKVHECFKMVHKKFRGTFDFLIKTDHDVFLRVDVLIPELAQIHSQHRSTISAGPLLHWRGFVYHSMPPMRDLLDKNADFSQSQFLTYPSFTAGVAYELSAFIVSELVEIQAPIYLLNEDQSLGVWMEQRILNGGRRFEPIHDTRFQQSDVCFPGQVTHHFMVNPITFHRQLFINIQNGINSCSEIPFSSCCLCCECISLNIKWIEWFRCDSRGAFLFTFKPLHTAIKQLKTKSPLSEHQKLGPLTSTKDIYDRIVLEHKSCSWNTGSWIALGFATIFRAKVPKSVTLRCLPPTYGTYESSLHFCAGSISFLPFLEKTLLCPPGPEKPIILRSHGHRERNWEFGFFNPTIKPKVAPSDATWILVSGWVTTERACLMMGLEDKSPQNNDYTGPPTFGTFSSLCGLVIDIKHSDGTSATLISAFARNASQYFHAEIFRVFHSSPLKEAIVTAIMPPANHTTWITLSDISLRILVFSDDRQPSFERAFESTLSKYTRAIDPRYQHLERSQRIGIRSSNRNEVVLFMILAVIVIIATRERIASCMIRFMVWIRGNCSCAYHPIKFRGE